MARGADPVKMYLKKMGSVSLLTREGEVEIAKRIEEMSDTNAIYISESTYARLKNPQIFTFHSKLTIKGKKDPIAIFKSFL